ncbi:CDP-alcohol phosphatidyltransferase family protein [Sandaracinus amylolyticus]|uniref:CDP-alcohol phosphatidyltransferase family protein n=1 Tax=Sandaracinus amylolyticus TaxID=927083 RepID=UPI001F3F92B1|nr:CDP-alcohol phosphatidyltransferase family protein [Sandaracinus amylolyticus]UJR80640.1 CDP-alcohol phosphatidyltransferase [Sandaracinus amylolyticus]
MSHGTETSLLRELARPWNLMSLVRLPLAVLALLVRAEPLAVLGLMIVAGISDALDGVMARRANADPKLGEWLDPVCDKVFVLAVLAGVWIERQPPWWLLVLTATREILVVPAGLMLAVSVGTFRSRIEYCARPSGKATTVAQFLVLGALLFDLPQVALPAAIAAAVLGLAAGVEYGVRARACLDAPGPTRAAGAAE